MDNKRGNKKYNWNNEDYERIFILNIAFDYNLKTEKTKNKLKFQDAIDLLKRHKDDKHSIKMDNER